MQDGWILDSFGEIHDRLNAMGTTEREETLQGYRRKCICPQCPTYTPCMREKEEGLFCTAGRSACGPVNMGCICPSCPVFPVLSLAHMSYCSKGSERGIRMA